MKQVKLLLSFCAFLIIGTAYSQESPLWMRYPAISPDGQYIVFTFKGDLYKVQSSGGQATPLTTHSAYEFQPIWSKDGKSIAFASDRYGNFDIFVMPSTGGKAKRLTYHSTNDYPSDFTPDCQAVIFSSLRLDQSTNAQFPYGGFPELYQIPVSGGHAKLVTSITAQKAKFNKDGTEIIFQDRKGYENNWRKHHTSSVARNIWKSNLKKGTYTQLTEFNGEDRDPLFSSDNKSYFYLSEESGSFNIHKSSLDKKVKSQQLTKFKSHPIRFLSASNNDKLCFSYHGEIYTQIPGKEPQKINIQIFTDTDEIDYTIESVSSGATEMALSPNGKEIAFVFRGEVFVAPVDGGDTKRITNTPSQERSVSFSPDGKKILYAGERDGSWNIYQTKIKREEEPYFYASTILEESIVIASEKDEFQPNWSPDGKEVAYLEERVELKVVNLESKKTRTIVEAKWNYSYSDGDQFYSWSPDGKWFLVEFLPEKKWTSECGIISSSGNGEIKNITRSGFSDGAPQWMMDGKMMMWFSDRDGMKNRGSWGSEADVYATFFTQEAADLFQLSKSNYALYQEIKKEKEKEEKSEDENKDKKNKDGDKKNDLKELKIDLDDIKDRKVKLTIHSSRLNDAVVSNDGKYLYYICRFESGNDLWKTNLRTKETKILTKLGGSAGSLTLDKKGKNIFLISGGTIKKIDPNSGSAKSIRLNGEMYLDRKSERAYIFEHSWRQVKKKFYVKNLHGVDWDFYKKEYEKFLPHINNNYDFTEMLSELLGELNASHTGSGYRFRPKNPDSTPSLGLFFDHNYKGNGLKIVEVLKKGPSDKAELNINAGDVVEKIDGNSISQNTNYFQFINRKSGKKVLLSLYNPKNKKRWEEVIEPISNRNERNLLYNRWVDKRKKEVEKLSDGKVGYVHVRGMNDASFRTVYEDVLGFDNKKEAIIVDTRFNGGGWLHDDLATFLSGKKYIEMVPRGQNLGSEPQFKWTKSSVVLVGEGNYSDAHMFPYAYRANAIGQIIGMPVPGTGTAVWWENQIDPSIYFGIPQVGMKDVNGNFLENQQLEPDVKIANKPESLLAGKDDQIAKAIEVLLSKKSKFPDPTKVKNLEKK